MRTITVVHLNTGNVEQQWIKDVDVYQAIAMAKQAVNGDTNRAATVKRGEELEYVG